MDTDPNSTPVPDAIVDTVVSEIGSLEDEIARIQKYGINADQEDKSPAEEYVDAIAERRMVHDLQEQIQKIRERNVEPLAEMMIADLQQHSTDDIQTLVSDTYSTLDQILNDLVAAYAKVGDIEQVIRKLDRTLENGMYLQKGEL
jgi:Mg2+ and Co2+ transporter CorA